MNKTVRIATLLFLCVGQTYGMQRLPREIQEELEARHFINEISTKPGDEEKISSNAMAFVKLYPRFAHNQEFIDTLLDIYNGKFYSQDLAKLLAKNGIEPAKQWLLDSHLAQAAFWADSKEIEKIIKEGARVSLQIDGKFPLELAATRRNNDALLVLLTYGAPVNAANKYGKTALMAAARSHDLQGVKILLAHKADPNLKDRFGQTALHSAVYIAREASERTSAGYLHQLAQDSIAIIDALLAAGADLPQGLI
jgi:ankyrin repeat protein